MSYIMILTIYKNRRDIMLATKNVIKEYQIRERKQRPDSVYTAGDRWNAVKRMLREAGYTYYLDFGKIKTL
jgi:hypothetical protein